jgi:hypothetical protein
MVAPAAVMAKVGDIWSLWGCAACVEKEPNEKALLFICQFHSAGRGAAPPQLFARARCSERISVDIDPACMHA